VGYDMTSTMTLFVQQANLEVKVLVKCKNSLGGRAWHNFVKVGDI